MCFPYITGTYVSENFLTYGHPGWDTLVYFLRPPSFLAPLSLRRHSLPPPYQTCEVHGCDFDVAFLAPPPSIQLEEQDQEISRCIRSSSPEPQHPLIAGTLPSAPLLAHLRQSHRRTVTNTPVTTSAPPVVYSCPIHSLSDFISPPLSPDTPNTTVFNACPIRSSSLKSFASYSLNPAYPAFQSPFSCPGSRANIPIRRIPSEDCRALSVGGSPSSMSTTAGSRENITLYRLSAVKDSALRLPPSSIDSKYPAGCRMTERGLVTYAYDPSKDDETEDDMRHLKMWRDEGSTLSWRGFINVSAPVALIEALLCFFLFYPVYRASTDSAINKRIARNTRVNVTGQVEPSSFDTRAGALEVDI